MATYYVRSTDGSNADDGSTWALAEADLNTPTWAAGDVIYVSQAHAQTVAGTAVTIATNGTAANPTKIICVNDAAEPPTAVSTGATVATTTSGILQVTGSCYVYGIQFDHGSGANTTSLGLNSAASGAAVQHYEQCKFNCNVTSTGGRIGVGTNSGSATGSEITWTNCEAKFANASQGIGFTNVKFRWNGGAITSGGTALTGSLFKSASGAGRMTDLLVTGVDLSGLGAACSIFDATTMQRGVVRGCKLPASWSGALSTGTIVTGFRAEMYDCASGDTHHSFWIEDYPGSVREEATIVRTGGAARSMKFVTNANAEFPAVPLVGPEVFIPNTSTGSSVTVEAEIITDNVTLADAEIWLEVAAKTTSGSTQSTWNRDVVASILATPANQTTSSATWTTTGLTTPVKQTLSVSFTPQEEGAFIARVVVCKASTTVYVDPPRKV